MFHGLFRELKETAKLLLIAIATLAISSYSVFFGYLAYAWASYRIESAEPLTTAEIDVLETNIERRLEAEDY
ncbi:MAG: hypothetical protein QMC36_06160 [Patescibacteria group bacterium]